MSPESHTLSLESRRAMASGTIVSWDGYCSCGKWRTINHAKADIREAHAQHVAERLAPKEATDGE